ncbi:protein of unknown function UPF0102 [Alkaliphilus metalliredigens QYMF]|uniref:UPF0102 protein Amet_2739 n=1 Tax=Alkaliphilus metalliredigens (strain QYMF) TaxID=293826 RepID=Y2739_ALKMQ|nr:YraN family protein [Alkaliphilus metalliredigens]A6TRS2.1 RecName: Full=UPF0102 protein Amet_2739 [Alkaliphilus metalliredigens QYMF]ABR48890.1 protein of unknown function UPF0102 [Alkaliphilus metalliredigens QYMF]
MSKSLGELGERIIGQYLEKKGYRLIETNYRTKLGEIDIIAYKGTIIAFVEVKTRRSQSYGMPCEAVNWQKQQRLHRVASHYIARKGLINYDFRFDVAEVIIGKEKKIHYINNAF